MQRRRHGRPREVCQLWHQRVGERTLPASSARSCKAGNACKAVFKSWQVPSVSGFLCFLQFLVISYVVGKEAVGHIQHHRAPEEGGLLLCIAIASVLVLGTLCGLKYDLSVRANPLLE